MKNLLPKIVPLLAIITGLYWIAGAFEYGLWIRKGPGGGFLPLLAGIAAVIFSLWIIIREQKDQSAAGFSRQACLPVAALIALVLSSYIIGLILSIAVFIFLWLKVVEKYKTMYSLVTGIVCATVLYGIFGAWLQVPLPLGLFELI